MELSLTGPVLMELSLTGPVLMKLFNSWKMAERGNQRSWNLLEQLESTHNCRNV